MLAPPIILSSDPVATLAAQARRRTLTQPTVAELVALAIAGTDFLGDISASGDTMALAAEYADQAAERWEDAREEMPGSVLPELIEAARVVLRDCAESVLRNAESDADDALLDGIESGDLDDDGQAVGYDTLRA